MYRNLVYSKPIMKIGHDFAGRICRDETRGIALIEYDNDGHPVRTVFESGDQQRDVWDGMGNHLSTEFLSPNSSGTLTRTLLRKYNGRGMVFEDGTLRMARFPGGYFSGTMAFYYIADYQGNNIAVVNSAGNMVERTGYYPYGEPWEEASVQPFLFSGNERLLMDGIHEYDFHDRRYNPVIPSFSSWDKCQEKYPWLSPYSYCAGNPVNAVDDDGKVIIFVNGLEGGGSGKAGYDYWNRPNASFIKGAQKFLNDKYTFFPAIDHNFISSASERYNKGKEYGLSCYESISSNLGKDETIKFVTHSMGAAFAEGMAKTFIEKGLNVETLVHINPYQASKISTVDSNTNNVTTIDFQDQKDPVINFLGLKKSGDINNADIKIRSNYSGGLLNYLQELRYIHAGPLGEGESFWNYLEDRIKDNDYKNKK